VELPPASRRSDDRFGATKGSAAIGSSPAAERTIAFAHMHARDGDRRRACSTVKASAAAVHALAVPTAEQVPVCCGRGSGVRVGLLVAPIAR
jgi:hypothetical protein